MKNGVFGLLTAFRFFPDTLYIDIYIYSFGRVIFVMDMLHLISFFSYSSSSVIKSFPSNYPVLLSIVATLQFCRYCTFFFYGINLRYNAIFPYFTF